MKTRRVQVKKGKSRRFRMKRGGEINKKDPNMPIITSQMGGVAPAPAAAAGATMVNTPALLPNINASLKAFGDALSVLNTAVKDSSSNPSGPIATSKVHMTEATTNAANAINLQKISEAAYTAFRTGKSGVGNGKGVYDNVLSGVTAGSPAVQVAYVPDTTVTPTPVADLAGAYATAKSLWVAAGSPGGTFPEIGVWAASEGIATS